MSVKLNSIKKELETHQVDAIILISDLNREWYNGLESDFGFNVFTKDEVYIMLDSRDYDIANRQIKLPNHHVVVFKEFNDWVNLIKKLKINNVLVEGDLLSLNNFNTYIEPLHLKTVKYFNSANLRMVKSPEEIANIKISCNIACGGIEMLKKYIKPGVSEKQAAQKLLCYFVQHGASEQSFPAIISFGDHSSDIHSVPTERKYKKGENILVDCGCVYNGYCSDITRCWGSTDKRIKEMYQVVLQANLIGIKHLKAQVIGNQLDNLVRQHIIKNYHGYDYPHGTGHGLGRVVHENPRVNKIYDKPLLENSLVTIEPGIYIPGFGGIRIEDTILITKTGCEVLTSKSKK